MFRVKFMFFLYWLLPTCRSAPVQPRFSRNPPTCPSCSPPTRSGRTTDELREFELEKNDTAFPRKFMWFYSPDQTVYEGGHILSPGDEHWDCFNIILYRIDYRLYFAGRIATSLVFCQHLSTRWPVFTLIVVGIYISGYFDIGWRNSY